MRAKTVRFCERSGAGVTFSNELGKVLGAAAEGEERPRAGVARVTPFNNRVNEPAFSTRAASDRSNP